MAHQVRGPDPGRSWAHLGKRSLLLTLQYPAATFCLRHEVTFCRRISCHPSYPEAEALELLQCWPILSSCAAAGWLGFQKCGSSSCYFASPFLKKEGWRNLALCFSLNSWCPREPLKNSEVVCLYLSPGHRHIPSSQSNFIPTTGPKPSLWFLGCSPLWLSLEQ